MAQGINQTAELPAGAALGAAQNVTSRVTNYNYSISANYANQSQASILSDIRMLELLHS